ncbi:MAG: hypothetical protein ABW069_16815 [Duganella sp.]
MKTSILRQLIVLPLLTAVMAMLYACGSASGSGRSAAAPQRFTTTYVLPQGGSAVIAPAAGSVVRLDRVNDSRCREGAVCVWAGYISYSFTVIRPDGRSSNFVLSDSMPNGARSITRDGLTFTLAGVEPQAVPPKNDIIPDYRVTVRVSNAPQATTAPRPS